jgi:hypothetical protein
MKPFANETLYRWKCMGSLLLLKLAELEMGGPFVAETL